MQIEARWRLSALSHHQSKDAQTTERNTTVTTTDLHVHRLSTSPNWTICGKAVSDVLAADVMHPDDVTCEHCARAATTSDDPAHFLLTDGVTSSTTVYNAHCYICRDPEFAAMGLPLCYPCPTCKAHTPADDMTCDNGHDTYPEEYGPAPDGTPSITDVPTGEFL